MKTTHIKSLLLVLALMLGSLMAHGATYYLTGTSGCFGVENYSYTNDMMESWYINTYTFQPITITYDINSENNYDFVNIYSVSNTGVETLLCELSGSGSATISTNVPSGRAKIEFISDGSVCYAEGYQEYWGFYLEYTVGSYTFSESFLTNGNAMIAGNLGVGISNPATRLHINGAIRGGGGCPNSEHYLWLSYTGPDEFIAYNTVYRPVEIPI